MQIAKGGQPSVQLDSDQRSQKVGAGAAMLWPALRCRPGVAHGSWHCRLRAQPWAVVPSPCAPPPHPGPQFCCLACSRIVQVEQFLHHVCS